MKIILLLIVLFSSAGITQAQEWKRYTVEGEDFSVLLPALPAMTTTRAPRKQDYKYRVQRQLETGIDGLLFMIEVYENPKPEQSLEEFIRGNSEGFQCDPSDQRTFTIDGYSARECSSADKDHPAVAQFLATETRLYRFVVRRRPDVPADAGQQFLSSIRLAGNTDAIKVSDGPGNRVFIGKETDTKALLQKIPEIGRASCRERV